MEEIVRDGNLLMHTVDSGCLVHLVN